MSDTTIGITFDPDRLASYNNEFLSTLWQVAQANPAPHGDYHAGEIASRIGFEIIHRWLKGVNPEMYRHQQRDNYWSALTKFAKYRPPTDVDSSDPRWHDGEWVPKSDGEEPR